MKYEIIPSDDGDYLTKYKATTQEGINNVADEFYNNVTSGNVPPNPFVHLRTSITEVGFDVDMPKCGTTISGDDPQGSVEVRDITGCEVQSAYITESDDSEAAFAGPVEGGEKVPLLIKLAPKWGYSLDNSCTAKSSTANVNYAGVSGGVITVKAEALIPHDAEAKEAKAATCTENGVKAHYQCKNQNCNKYLLEKKAPGSDKAVLVEVEEDEIITESSLGHEWGEWFETTSATEEAEGVEARTCTRCNEEETRAIPAIGHVHSMTHVDAKPATCSSEGSIAYYKCSGCGLCFKDEEGSQELTPWEIVIPQTRHDWEQPAEFTTSSIGDTYYMTGSMKCRNDASHVISETVPAVTEITPATCETDGFIDWTGHFTNQTFGTHRMLTPLPAPGHAWNYSSDEAWDVTKKATCSETGEETRTCSRCNKKETKEIPIDPKAHDTYLEIDETTDTATCEESGRATQYEVCSICEEVIKQKRINTEPAGHSWGKPVYKWSEDMSEATATRTCTRSGCGEEESETVKTTNRIMEKASDEAVGRAIASAELPDSADVSRLIVIPANLDAKVTLEASGIRYDSLDVSWAAADIAMKQRTLQITNALAASNMGDIYFEGFYSTRSKKDIKAGFDLNLVDITAEKVITLFPAVDTLMPMLRSFAGDLDCELAVTSDVDTLMNLVLPSIDGVMRISGKDLSISNESKEFKKIAKYLMFKDKGGANVDKMAVTGMVRDNVLEVFPFVLDVDRYTLAASGLQHLDESFQYHLSVIKSPLLVKFGINIWGDDFDHIKYGLGKAKYRSVNVPVFTKQLDTVQYSLLASIHNIFELGVEKAIAENNAQRYIQDRMDETGYSAADTLAAPPSVADSVAVMSRRFEEAAVEMDRETLREEVLSVIKSPAKKEDEQL